MFVNVPDFSGNAEAGSEDGRPAGDDEVGQHQSSGHVLHLFGDEHAVLQLVLRDFGFVSVRNILPIVQKQTASVGVTQKYKDFSKKAGGNALAGALLGGGSGQPMNGADLDDYVTRRTIDGLFHVITIRSNPDPIHRRSRR